MSEHDLHIFTANLLRLAHAPNVMFFHVPNGEYRSKRTGAKLKAMGVIPGVADFALVLPSGRAAFLELKSEKGRQSIGQRRFEQACRDAGAQYAVANSPEEVTAILEAWGAIRPCPVSARASIKKRAA